MKLWLLPGCGTVQFRRKASPWPHFTPIDVQITELQFIWPSMEKIVSEVFCCFHGKTVIGGAVIDDYNQRHQTHAHLWFCISIHDRNATDNHSIIWPTNCQWNAGLFRTRGGGWQILSFNQRMTNDTFYIEYQPLKTLKVADFLSVVD